MPTSIESYAMIGDLQTAALVGLDGSVDWACLPRFDSSACFAALLHDEQAGHWRIAPAGSDGGGSGSSGDPGRATTRHYRGDTLVLETQWDTPTGSVRVIDFMPPRGHAADIVRIVEGVSGAVPMTMQLRIRFDYGHIVPWVRRDPNGLCAVAGPDALWLRTEVPLHGRDLTTHSEFTVRAGQRVPFVLTYKPSHHSPPTPIDPERALAETEAFWTGWIEQCHYDGPWSSEVRRALIVLKALTYAPTGGILAAATTSLPEQLGGERNWDYRYCWLRDATFTLQALLGAGFVNEATAWRDWLLRAAAGDPADLRIMYGLDGTRRLPEYTLDWLKGFDGSSPVRVGNAAADQFQLDVWGEVLDGLHLTRETRIGATDDAWDLQRALLEFLESNWREPDNSLWEVRGSRQHFVHSKVMAWTGFDRAIKAVERHRLDGPVDKWRALRDEVHAEVCRHGFDAERNTFTQYYGSSGLDAALLLIPRTGFLPWTDPRVAGTVDAVVRELSVDGFVLRYDPGHENVDGLAGSEGVFLACSFWLVDALHALGRQDQARQLFERLLSLRNDVGLLSEEYDPSTGRQLGNTPQAFSMVGLVNSARHLTDPTAALATASEPHHTLNLR